MFPAVPYPRYKIGCVLPPVSGFAVRAAFRRFPFLRGPLHSSLIRCARFFIVITRFNYSIRFSRSCLYGYCPQYSSIRAGHTVLLSPVTRRPPAVGFVAPDYRPIAPGSIAPAVRLHKIREYCPQNFFRTVCVLSCPCRDAGWRRDGRFNQ